MDQALVKLIPSRIPYFLMIIGLVSVLCGVLEFVLRYQYEAPFRKGIKSAMGWRKWNPVIRGRLFGAREDISKDEE
jgi:hypothetical protein